MKQLFTLESYGGDSTEYHAASITFEQIFDSAKNFYRNKGRDFRTYIVLYERTAEGISFAVDRVSKTMCFKYGISKIKDGDLENVGIRYESVAEFNSIDDLKYFDKMAKHCEVRLKQE